MKIRNMCEVISLVEEYYLELKPDMEIIKIRDEKN